MKFLSKHQRSLRLLGYALLILSAAFLYFAADSFFAVLPNYARVLSLLPVACAASLVQTPTFANWNNATDANKIRAGGSLVVIALVLVGTLCWLIFAPNAQT